MKKYTAIFCALLFVCGGLIVPALHEAGICFSHHECADTAEPDPDHEHEHDAPDSDGERDEPDDCAICQLASTPAIAGCSAIEIRMPRPTADTLLLADAALVSRPEAGTFHARAPPSLPSS